MEKHHAQLLRGNTLNDASVPQVYKLQSADVLHLVRDRFSIDDARELRLLASQTPFEAQERVFVIVTHDIATEAQNALLKLFEEPPVHARFYLVLPHGAVLLPTLASRLSSNQEQQYSNEASTDDVFSTFCASSYGERLAEIALKTKNKDVQWIETIVLGAERTAAQNSTQLYNLMQAVVFARKYMRNKGASQKMLLEEIALQLPVL